MYFSRIRIRTQDDAPGKIAGAMRGSFYNEHKMIWNFFPPEKHTARDFLYRRYETGNMPQYFILSQRKPVNEQGIWEIQTKEFDPVINDGGHFSFSLRVNPVVTKMPEGRESKKRKRDDIFMEALAQFKKLPLNERPSNNEIMVESGRAWIMERAERYGFTILSEHVLVEGYKKMESVKDRDGNRIQIGVMDFSGILTVNDAGLFRETLVRGIGKSKSFGCGLLLIKRV